MKIVTTKTYEELSQKTANVIVECVKNKPTATICLASGDSPVGTYRELTNLALKGQADFSQCTFVGLDEWVGLGKDDEGSCAYFLYRDFFEPLKIPTHQLHFFDAKKADLEAECKKIDNVIFKNGGLDLLLVGVGMNGHIALNEPNTSFENYCHVVELDEITKQVGQKYFSKNTILTQGITLGLKHLQEAKEVILIANGERKAAIIQQALEGEISEKLPAGIIQQHPNAIVILDAAAARLLNSKTA